MNSIQVAGSYKVLNMSLGVNKLKNHVHSNGSLKTQGINSKGIVSTQDGVRKHHLETPGDKVNEDVSKTEDFKSYTGQDGHSGELGDLERDTNDVCNSDVDDEDNYGSTYFGRVGDDTIDDLGLASLKDKCVPAECNAYVQKCTSTDSNVEAEIPDGSSGAPNNCIIVENSSDERGCFIAHKSGDSKRTHSLNGVIAVSHGSAVLDHIDNGSARQIELHSEDVIESVNRTDGSTDHKNQGTRLRYSSEKISEQFANDEVMPNGFCGLPGRFQLRTDTRNSIELVNPVDATSNNAQDEHSADQYLKIREDPDSEDDEPLSIIRKICFAVGGAPYQITSTVIGFFLNIFLLEVAEIPPKYISIILFGGKAWDAITDPMVGYLVNRTNTRCGKMKPWIILSAPLACVSYFFLWYVPDLSDEGKLAYYFALFCAFEGFLSGLHVPYTSLTMYISNDQKERDSATAYRMVSEAIGVLIGVIVQGKLIEKYRTAGGDCENPGSTPSPEQLDKQKWSYMVGAGVVISIYICCALIVFFGVKEKKRGIAESHDNSNFCEGLKLVFTFGPYVKAAMTFLFLFFAIAITQGNIALYCTHSIDMGSQFANFILVLLIVSIVSMPLWQLVVIRFGKKTAYAAGMIIFIPVLVSLLYLPKGNPYVYYVGMVIAGLSISVALLLPWSVLPDVLDLFMLETKTRKDALFYSFYVFFNKFAAGLALAVSQLALQYGGYVTGACKQPESVDQTLRLLVAPGPVVSVLIALLFLWRYPINETKRKWIKQQVQEVINGPQKTETEDDQQSSISYESIRITYSTEF